MDNQSEMMLTWTRMGAVKMVRSGQILVKMTLFADGLDERKHRVKDDPEVWGQSSCIWGRTACWQEGNAGYGLQWLISCANLARPWSPEIQLDTGMEVAVEGIF